MIYHTSKRICACVGTCTCDRMPLLKGPAFSCEYCKNFKSSFFYGTHLIAASGFIKKLAENNVEENHFSVEKLLRNYFLLLAAAFSKNNSFTGFQFLFFFKHTRGVSRTQLNIKMEPFAKIVNYSLGVFRTESDI